MTELDDADKAIIRDFLTGVDDVRKEQIRFVLSSAINVRTYASSLSLTESFAAFTHELNTFQRTSILTRLRQRACQRASDIIDEYLKTLEGEVENG
jgi:hypothetical protein